MTVTHTPQETQKTINWWKRFTRLQNPLMKWLLESRLHFFVSGYYMLMTVTGRKSGKVYTTPVQYKQINDQIFVITSRNYLWWKNLRDGAEVKLRLRGVDVTGWAEVSLNPDHVRDAFDKLYPSMKSDQKEKLVEETVVLQVTGQALMNHSLK